MLFEKRIIIGGLPRAGTTLFRYVLDGSEKIICINETAWFLRPLDFSKAKPKRVAQRRSERLQLNAEIIEKIIINSNNSIDSFDKIISEFVRTHNLPSKPIWAEKTPRNVEHYERLAKENNELYFFSLVRDGRDVVTSIIDGREKYHCTIERYIDSLEKVYKFDHYRHKIIKYEDMVSDPNKIFKEVFNFLDLEFSKNYLSSYLSDSVTRDSRYVNQPNVKKAIDTRWIQRWRDDKYIKRIDEFYNNPSAIAWLKKSGYDISR